MITNQKTLEQQSDQKLKELLNYKIAIIEDENTIKVSDVGDILIPFEMDISYENTGFYLRDDQDESYNRFLGETVEKALATLNDFDDLFNDDDTWQSDFEYFIPVEKNIKGVFL